MLYLTMAMCRQEIFPYIHAELTKGESAAEYQDEESGLFELEKILSFVQHDGYYPSFYDKAAYLICSIAGAQHFSNGNKRLSIVVLMKFLGLNETLILLNKHEALRSLLEAAFPQCQWEDNARIADPHAHFLYNLAIVIGDKTVWGTTDFSGIKQRIADIFSALYLV